MDTHSLIDRLATEADLCRNDGADDIARLLDEAREALEADAVGWRPIETAPRDGTRILLWRDWLTLDDRAVCYWHSDLRNWYAVGQYVFNDALLWQPLPPPPQP